MSKITMIEAYSCDGIGIIRVWRDNVSRTYEHNGSKNQDSRYTKYVSKIQKIAPPTLDFLTFGAHTTFAAVWNIV